MFAFLLHGLSTVEPANVVRLIFGPLRPYVANWDALAPALLQRVHREAVGGVPDPRTRALLDEVLARPDIPERWRTPRTSAHHWCRWCRCGSPGTGWTCTTSRW